MTSSDRSLRGRCDGHVGCRPLRLSGRAETVRAAGISWACGGAGVGLWRVRRWRERRWIDTEMRHTCVSLSSISRHPGLCGSVRIGLGPLQLGKRYFYAHICVSTLTATAVCSLIRCFSLLRSPLSCALHSRHSNVVRRWIRFPRLLGQIITSLVVVKRSLSQF